MKDADNKRLYTYVPGWMIRLLEKKKCSSCKHPISRVDIRAIGLREIKAGNSTYYLEYTCSSCNKAVIANLNRDRVGTPEDLCYALIEQMQRNRRIERAQKSSSRTKGYIRDEEVKELLEFMDTLENHEDFLKYIGADIRMPDEKTSDEN